MSDIDAIEARDLWLLMERLHTKGQIDGQDACTFCDHLWPCDAARLLDALRAAEEREARLREALADFADTEPNESRRAKMRALASTEEPRHAG